MSAQVGPRRSALGWAMSHMWSTFGICQAHATGESAWRSTARHEVRRLGGGRNADQEDWCPPLKTKSTALHCAGRCARLARLRAAQALWRLEGIVALAVAR